VSATPTGERVVVPAATRSSVPAWGVTLAVVAVALVGVPLLVDRVVARVTAARPVGTTTGHHDVDAATLARALVALLADRSRRGAAAAHGPALGRPHDRDVLAGHTEDVYLAAARAGRGLERRGLVRR
jgi:hypothetical protein